MAHIQAFVVITLLTWAAVTVSGTTTELSTTAGDTVNIACLFGEGTLRHIFWYYDSGNGPQKILFLANGELTKAAKYANRTSLQDDSSTLILKGIAVADEGTYRCVVDRQGQTVVPNIRTKLNVFSTRPNTLPVITPCPGADESSSCSIHTNRSFTLTCTLPNVYPFEDTELIWYQGGKRVSSTYDVTQNDDGTTYISRQIQVSETGNFTCNATYLSASGRENTAVSVKACIIPLADVPNTPGKNLTSGQIAGLTMGVVLLVAISLAINNLFVYRSKARDLQSSRKGQHKSDETQPYTADSEPLRTSAENGFKDGKVKSAKASELLGISAENGLNFLTVGLSPFKLPSPMIQRDVNRQISDAMLYELARYVPSYAYDIFSEKLGIERNHARSILVKYNSDYEKATMECFAKWMDRSTRSVADLHGALREAELGGLIVYC